MPLNGEKVDELLSGYLDGNLSQAESAEVERALEDAAVRQRYDELLETRERLRELRDARLQAAPGLSASFAAKVWEQIEAGKVALPSTDESSIKPPLTTELRRSRQQWMALGVMLIGAAAVLLWLNPFSNRQIEQADNEVAVVDPAASPTDTDNAVTADADEASPFSDDPIDVGTLVSEQWRQQVMFTVVADIQLSHNAVKEDFLANTFKAHGIELQQPVLADAEMLQALSDSQMSERPQAAEGEALLYFVHADSVDLDRTLQIFINDVNRVPNMWTDVAFDTPVNQLMLRIIARAGNRFSIDESFAAQVNIRRTSGSKAMVSGISTQGKLVSRTAAESGDAQPLAAGAIPDGKNTILLVVRLPK